MAKEIKDIPFTKVGQNMDLSEQSEKDLRVVYRKNDEGDLCFYGMYNENEEYTDDDYIVPFRAVVTSFKKVEKDYSHIVLRKNKTYGSLKYRTYYRSKRDTLYVNTADELEISASYFEEDN